MHTQLACELADIVAQLHPPDRHLPEFQRVPLLLSHRRSPFNEKCRLLLCLILGAQSTASLVFQRIGVEKNKLTSLQESRLNLPSGSSKQTLPVVVGELTADQPTLLQSMDEYLLFRRGGVQPGCLSLRALEENATCAAETLLGEYFYRA